MHTDPPMQYLERDINGRLMPKQYILPKHNIRDLQSKRVCKGKEVQKFIEELRKSGRILAEYPPSQPVSKCPKWIKSLVNVIRHRA